VLDCKVNILVYSIKDCMKIRSAVTVIFHAYGRTKPK